jgi:hypothetical protein
MSTINANFVSDTGPTALIKTADDTGTLALQTGGITAVTIGTDQNVVANSTGAWTMPVGTTAQRPGTATEGMTRFNTTAGSMEIYIAGTWTSI